MITTILLLYILNTLTPLPNWIIITVWVLTIICGIVRAVVSFSENYRNR